MTGTGTGGAAAEAGAGGGASGVAAAGLRSIRRRVTFPAGDVVDVLPTLPDPSSPRATAIKIPPGEVMRRAARHSRSGSWQPVIQSQKRSANRTRGPGQKCQPNLAKARRLAIRLL